MDVQFLLREMGEDITVFIASVSNHSAGHEPGQLLSRALGCVCGHLCFKGLCPALLGRKDGVGMELAVDPVGVGEGRSPGTLIRDTTSLAAA